MTVSKNRYKNNILIAGIILLMILLSIFFIYKYQKKRDIAHKDQQVIINICEWAKINHYFLALQKKIALNGYDYAPINPSMMWINPKFPQIFIYYWKSSPANSVYCKIWIDKDFRITKKT